MILNCFFDAFPRIPGRVNKIYLVNCPHPPIFKFWSTNATNHIMIHHDCMK